MIVTATVASSVATVAQAQLGTSLARQAGVAPGEPEKPEPGPSLWIPTVLTVALLLVAILCSVAV